MTAQLEQIIGHVSWIAGMLVVGVMVWRAVLAQPSPPGIDSPEQRRRRGLAAANRGRRG